MDMKAGKGISFFVACSVLVLCSCQPAARVRPLDKEGAGETVTPEETIRKHRAERREAAHRRRRILFNNDGDCTFLLHKDKEPTPENLLAQRTTPLVGSQVDTLIYSTSLTFSLFTHNTRVGEIFTGPVFVDHPTLADRRNITQALIDQGTDPLQVMIDFARQNNMEIFWNIRMNDAHDHLHTPARPHPLWPQFKEDHPQFLLGSRENPPRRGLWSAVDFTHPEIRELKFRYLEEVCQNYDIDGIHLDFFRMGVFFKRVAEGLPASQLELDMMTGLMRRLRQMTEREGIKRGRPILMAVRVPDSVEFNREMGLDLERWLAEGLVDILIAGGDFLLNPWEYSVNLGNRFDVPVYANLDPSVLWLGGRFPRNQAKALRARAMNAWAAGASGIAFFNHFNPYLAHWREVGDPEVLKRLDKLYFVNVVSGTGFFRAENFLYGGKRFENVPTLHPGRPESLVAGQPLSLVMRVGDDVLWGEEEGVKVDITGYLQVRGIARAEQLSIKLNDTVLENTTLSNDWLEFPVPPALVRSGVNLFEISLRSGEKAGEKEGLPQGVEEWDMVYEAHELLVFPHQIPWRRLVTVEDPQDRSEEIVNGALFMGDRGRGKEDMVSLKYPWNIHPASQTIVEARVKVASSSHPLGVCIRVADGASVEYLTLGEDGIGLKFAGLSYPMDTTGDFHTYRIVIQDEDIRVYVDGELKIEGSGRFTTSALDETHWINFLFGEEDWNKNSLLFGSATGPGTGEAYWDFLRFSTETKTLHDLVLSIDYTLPGEIAREISHWDVIYEGYKLPTAPWRRVEDGKDMLSEIHEGALLIIDDGTGRGDYLWFQYAWQVNPLDETIVEARVKTVSGWSGIIVGDGVSEEILQLHPDRILLLFSGHSYSMDTTGDFHLYRVVIKGNDIKVYVDGRLRIEGSGHFIRPAPGGRNVVSFGAANSPALGKAYWDFVRFSISAEGESATIRITEFELLFPTDDSFKVVVTAEAEGITVGSFGLRTAHKWGEERGELPGFKVGADGFARPEKKDIWAGDFDNGPLDEDPREGTYARTFSTRGWEPGNYEFLLSAHNRPAPGAYISDTFSINFTICGDGKIGPFQPPTGLVNIQGTDVVIFKERHAYAAFPGLMKLDDGRLVTSFTARISRAHIDPRGVSKTMVSNDGGLTWQDKDEPFFNPAWRTSDGRLVRISAEGWRWVCVSQRERLQQEERFIMDAFPRTIAYLSPEFVVATSRDGGLSWQKQSILAPDYVRGLMVHLEASSNLTTSDGTRLLAIYGRRRGSMEIDEVFIVRSTDEGKSWTFIPVLPEGPRKNCIGIGLNESALTETADGRILLMMRSHPEAYLWQSFSEDGGLTWSNPEETPMWGHPPHLLTLPDGRILCTYGYRRSPLGIRASLSLDHGRTWQINEELILRADGVGHSGDLGYPITKLLTDGYLFTIYYITLADNITHVAGTKWRVD